MRQFDYTQTILKNSIVSTHALTHKHIDDMFDDYESHLVLEEAHSIITLSDLSYVERYIKWFFRVSHSYMVHAAPRDPPKPAYLEILEEEHN